MIWLQGAYIPGDLPMKVQVGVLPTLMMLLLANAVVQVLGFIHGDIHDLAYQPGTNRLWACTDGGVYHTDNHGLHWNHKCTGLVTGQIYHLAVSDLNSNVMMIGQQDNGLRAKLSNSTHWNHVSGADGFDVIYNNNSSTNGFCTINKGIYEFNSNGDNVLLISSTD